MLLRKDYRKLSSFVKLNLTKSIGSLYFSIFLIFFGITIYFFPAVFRIISDFSYQLHFRVRQETQAQENNGPIYISSELLNSTGVFGDFPNRIIIPTVGIDLPVKSSRIINGIWETHDGAANFGLGSALPGTTGNSVIFAHAKWDFFLPLQSIRKDDQISVQTKSGKWHTYLVTEYREVRPDQLEIIAPTPDKTLTLFTCSGFADSKRLVVIAKEKVINLVK